MAKSQQNRKATKQPAGKGDPRQAMESGEPAVSGRSRGKQVAKGEPGRSPGKRQRDNVGEDFESGRHDAAV
jgi:hypothetical protein